MVDLAIYLEAFTAEEYGTWRRSLFHRNSELGASLLVRFMIVDQIRGNWCWQGFLGGLVLISSLLFLAKIDAYSNEANMPADSDCSTTVSKDSVIGEQLLCSQDLPGRITTQSTVDHFV